MGYTHYWSFKSKDIDYRQHARAVSEIQILLSRLPEFSETAGGHYNNEPIGLRSPDGTGKPILTLEEIKFNGDGRKNLDHESFWIDFNNLELSGFCKTARKPYDLAVCLCLLCLSQNIDGFKIGSDGDDEDWQQAYQIYNEFNVNSKFKSLILNN